MFFCSVSVPITIFLLVSTVFLSLYLFISRFRCFLVIVLSLSFSLALTLTRSFSLSFSLFSLVFFPCRSPLGPSDLAWRLWYIKTGLWQHVIIVIHWLVREKEGEKGGREREREMEKQMQYGCSGWLVQVRWVQILTELRALASLYYMLWVNTRLQYITAASILMPLLILGSQAAPSRPRPRVLACLLYACHWPNSCERFPWSWFAISWPNLVDLC